MSVSAELSTQVLGVASIMHARHDRGCWHKGAACVYTGRNTGPYAWMCACLHRCPHTCLCRHRLVLPASASAFKFLTVSSTCARVSLSWLLILLRRAWTLASAVCSNHHICVSLEMSMNKYIYGMPIRMSIHMFSHMSIHTSRRGMPTAVHAPSPDPTYAYAHVSMHIYTYCMST